MDIDEVDDVEGVVYESLPDEVVAGLEVRNAWRKELAANTAGLEFIVSDIVRWPVGSVVRVAFLDGTPTLHGEVASATAPITDVANLTLDFGHDPASGTYRRWTTADTEYAAEIRVSFDQGGYWSLLGTDSIDPTIAPSGPVGGKPGQRSLNLGGYKTGKPAGWQGTVRHEFLHALGFQHEHQNMRGPCQADFRWENDPGYVPTTNAQGVFVADAQGRRPGIYTYLAGPPNGWSRAKVDHNLKTEEDPHSVAGPFDPESVMLYRFGKLFYESDPSPCAPTGPGLELSDGDKRGLQLLYPRTEAPDTGLAEQCRRGLELVGAGEEGIGSGGPSSAHMGHLVELLSLHAAGRP